MGRSRPYLGLSLTTELGRRVTQTLPSSERTPAGRRQALIESLTTSGRLYADMQVPNVAGPLTIVADLRSRQVIASTTIDAPREGTSKGRVSWLLRQVPSAPESLKVEARLAYRSSPLAAPLAAVRADPSIIYPAANKEIRGFTLSLSSNMGAKRDAGRGSFVESVLDSSETFYGEVLQRLRPWKAAPPKLKKTVEPDESPEEFIAEAVGVDPEQIAPIADGPTDAEGDVSSMVEG